MTRKYAKKIRLFLNKIARIVCNHFRHGPMKKGLGKEMQRGTC